MATTLMVSASPRRVGAVNRGKPRKILKGELRTIVRKALAKLNSIMNADAREAARGNLLGYAAFSVMGDDNSVTGRAFTRVMARLAECLAAVEGDK